MPRHPPNRSIANGDRQVVPANIIPRNQQYQNFPRPIVQYPIMPRPIVQIPIMPAGYENLPPAIAFLLGMPAPNNQVLLQPSVVLHRHPIPEPGIRHIDQAIEKVGPLRREESIEEFQDTNQRHALQREPRQLRVQLERINPVQRRRVPDENRRTVHPKTPEKQNPPKMPQLQVRIPRLQNWSGYGKSRSQPNTRPPRNLERQNAPTQQVPKFPNPPRGTPRTAIPNSTPRGKYGNSPYSTRQRTPLGRMASGNVSHHQSPLTMTTRSKRIVVTREMQVDIDGLNARYIQRQDGEFVRISEKSPQGAIYIYKMGEGWAEAKAAGAVFLYERATAPNLGFIILNRYTRQNWNILFDAKDLEIQVEGHYLMFKDNTGIQCLWFYKNGESERLGNKLVTLGSTVAEKYDETEVPVASSSSTMAAGRRIQPARASGNQRQN